MKRMQNYWPVVVQLTGLVLLALAVGLLATWAGLAVGGLGLLAFGLAAEVGRR